MNTEDPGESKEDQRDEMDTDDDDQITKLENQANEAWEKREEKPLRRILNRMGGLLDVLVVDQSNDEHKRLSSLILKYSQHHRKLLDEKEDSEEEEKEAHSTNDQTLCRLTQANQDPKKKFQILHCEIHCDSLFTNDGKLRADQDNLLSIECLDELRWNNEKAEQFLPSNRMLYVRDCMQDMFQRLAERIGFFEKRILIGSPGVGKSILIFLAAIRQAQMIQQQQDEKVMFVRQTTSEQYISVFLMEPHPGLPSVVSEELMHCWFKESKPGCINDFVRSTGSQRDSPRELNKANLYWVPSTSNFPNIDAAFICNKTLVCLQYTVANKHNFNTKTFQQGFIDNLGYLEFECVEIYFVVPTGTDFQTSNEEEFSVQYNNNTMNCTAMCKQIEVDPSRNELIAAAIGRGIPGMYEEHGDASMLDA